LRNFEKLSYKAQRKLRNCVCKQYAQTPSSVNNACWRYKWSVLVLGEMWKT